MSLRLAVLRAPLRASRIRAVPALARGIRNDGGDPGTGKWATDVDPNAVSGPGVYGREGEGMARGTGSQLSTRAASDGGGVQLVAGEGSVIPHLSALATLPLPTALSCSRPAQASPCPIRLAYQSVPTNGRPSPRPTPARTSSRALSHPSPTPTSSPRRRGRPRRSSAPPRASPTSSRTVSSRRRIRPRTRLTRPRMR